MLQNSSFVFLGRKKTLSVYSLYFLILYNLVPIGGARREVNFFYASSFLHPISQNNCLHKVSELCQLLLVPFSFFAEFQAQEKQKETWWVVKKKKNILLHDPEHAHFRSRWETAI